MYQYPDYLMHYGVLGMKWGRRKSLSSVIKSKNRKRIDSYSSDYQETRKMRRKPSKKLSNAELKKLNERMRLEQEYNRLSTSQVNRGYEVAKKTVAIAGAIGGLYAISQSDYTKAGKALLDKAKKTDYTKVGTALLSKIKK